MNTQVELKKWAKALPKDEASFFEANPVRATTGEKTPAYKAVLELFQTDNWFIAYSDYETRLTVLAFAQAMDETGDLIVTDTDTPDAWGC